VKVVGDGGGGGAVAAAVWGRGREGSKKNTKRNVLVGGLEFLIFVFFAKG
jgi:hypothetical protein